MSDSQASGMSSDANERRRATRLKVRTVITAQIVPSGIRNLFAKPLNAMVVNVSPKGVGFHSKSQPPAVGTRVTVEILALGYSRKFSGHLRHMNVIQSGFLFGVEIETMSEESLISYLKSCEAEFEIR